jgi:hypothetical protein
MVTLLLGCGLERITPKYIHYQCMLEQTDAIMNEVLKPITLVLAYPTVLLWILKACLRKTIHIAVVSLSVQQLPPPTLVTVLVPPLKINLSPNTTFHSVLRWTDGRLCWRCVAENWRTLVSASLILFILLQPWMLVSAQSVHWSDFQTSFYLLRTQ